MAADGSCALSIADNGSQFLPCPRAFALLYFPLLLCLPSRSARWGAESCGGSMSRPRRLSAPALLLYFIAHAAVSSATTIDLTTSGAAILGADGVLWRQGPPDPLSDGVSEAFLRIQGVVGASTQQGFNTDFRPLPPDAVGTTVTHAIAVGGMAPRTITVPEGSFSMYSIYLDVNEPSTLGQSYLSLDALRLYTATSANIATLSELTSTATLRYDMDAVTDDVVLLDGNIEVGSGSRDLEILFPASLLAGASATHFLYVYAAMGGQGMVGGRDYRPQNGFEELQRLQLTATGVDDAVPAGGPWAKALGGGRSELRIRYYCPGPGRVRLSLFDLRGRKAAASFERFESGAGAHEATLRTSTSGRPLSSGIYFYRFEWEGERRTGKSVIVR